MAIQVLGNSALRDYSSYTPHEVFLMIKFGSEDAIVEIVRTMTSNQYTYIQQALQNKSKIQILEREWSKSHIEAFQKITTYGKKKLG